MAPALRTGILCVLTCVGLGGCLAGLSGSYPRNTSIVPPASVQLTENTNLSFATAVTAGAIAAAVYVVLDPLAPNWHIVETQYGNGQYRLSMQMKNFIGGGTGEARQVLQRRATDLARLNGFGGYQIVSFNEGVEFAYPVSRRVSEGVIQLVAGRPN